MNILILAGTVREGRSSIYAARLLKDVLEEKGHEPELFDLKEHSMPFLRNRRHLSEEDEVHENVELFGQKVEDCDEFVIVSPEYNHSIPGALKNALDHLKPEYEEKPFSYLMTGGRFGGARALTHLHEITLSLSGIPGPNLCISYVGKVFSDDGELKDEEYGRRIEEFADKIIAHAEKHS